MGKVKKSSGWVTTKNESSTIKFIKWESDNMLYVEFHNGGIYRYSNVDRETFEAFRNAESSGKYHAQHIKGNDKHPFTKM